MITSLKIVRKTQISQTAVGVEEYYVSPGSWINIDIKKVDESDSEMIPTSPFDAHSSGSSLSVSYFFKPADVVWYPIHRYYWSLVNHPYIDVSSSSSESYEPIGNNKIPYLTSITGASANDRGNVMLLGSETTNVDYKEVTIGPHDTKKSFVITDMAQTAPYTIIFNVIHDMLRQIRLWLDAHKDNLLLPNPDVEQYTTVPASVYMWNKMLAMEDTGTPTVPVVTTTKLYEGCDCSSASDDPCSLFPTNPSCAMPHFREDRQRDEVIPKSLNLLNEYKSLVFLWNSIVSQPIVQIHPKQHPEDPAGLYAIVVCSFMYPRSWYDDTSSENYGEVVLDINVFPNKITALFGMQRWATIVGYGSSKVQNDGASFAPDFNIPVGTTVDGVSVAQATMESTGAVCSATGAVSYKVHLTKSGIVDPASESSYGSFAFVLSDIPFYQRSESPSGTAPEQYYSSKYNSVICAGCSIQWRISAQISYPSDPYFDSNSSKTNVLMFWTTDAPKEK